MTTNRPAAPPLDPESLVYDQSGLLPVIAQDVASGAVLMVAWANQEAVELTLQSGQAHFWSRSREQLWRKGETSGNTLEVVEAATDCDRDTLLLRVRPAGPACHLGTRTCFEPAAPALELGWLASVIRSRRAAAIEESYTARLLAAGVDRIARKVGEEATETIVAAVRADAARAAGDPGAAKRQGELAGETADLLYHLLVLLEAVGVEPLAVARELDRRHASAGRPALP
jgi:phosphoribosyl-ATP pyrophosphohydrolase/phosphoribosyl-AMP cyclohydrolase